MRWLDASNIADIAMGTDIIPGRRGRHREVVKRADQDPLAHWCLVQLIMDRAEKPTLCEGCPPVGYPNDKTRCHDCPRRKKEK